MAPSSPPFDLFFSYSHRDDGLRVELEKHLTILRRQGAISGWHDRRITGGSDWAGVINERINAARIVLLLVSADFLDSDYCYDVEMRRALERQSSGDARVVPVILRAVDWAGAPFAHLQALPTDGRPVTSWENRDEAFADVARGVRKAIADLQAADPSAGDASHYFAAQRQIIGEHVRWFVPRHDLTRALQQFRADRPRGYFIVRGGPGQGKTALAAYLSSVHGDAHHFVSRSGGRSDIRLILCSLLAQVAPKAGTRVPFSAALPELAKVFEETVARLPSLKRGPLMIVIDALDELTAPPGDDVSFLPVETLPDGAYFVVTSRPGERLDALNSRLLNIPHETFDLRPLEPDQVRALIASAGGAKSEAVTDRLVRAARGNPLYVRTALSVMRADTSLELSELPAALNDYYRRATGRLPDTSVLRDVLGVLAVSRRSLSSSELAQITGRGEREIRTAGVSVIREFLRESPEGVSFYHQHFHDFVTRELMFADELRHYHLRVADWLQRPERAAHEYRWTSLAHHLYQSRNRERLWSDINASFLSDKIRRFGYAVLDDIEYLTKSFLEADDPALVERCVGIVDELRNVVGSDIIEDAAHVVQFGGAGERHPRGVVTPPVRSISGIDVYVGMLPKGPITADFVEIVPRGDQLLIAIGDAPSSGIKSAFVARFIANVFGALASATKAPTPAALLNEVSRRVFSHQYFEWVSMQCVELNAKVGRLAIANAGQPFPVLYSAARERWDTLPVRGELLHSGELGSREPHEYDERHAEIEVGDVVVLLSDGLTEASARFHDPYGYRFARLLPQWAGLSARQIGEHILESWQAHPRAEDWADDVTVVVAIIRPDCRGVE